MILCNCGEPAEVSWRVTGERERRQKHLLCSNCMSSIWAKVNLDYPTSNAQQCSVFEAINQ